jgi:hypothetical protein
VGGGAVDGSELLSVTYDLLRFSCSAARDRFSWLILMEMGYIPSSSSSSKYLAFLRWPSVQLSARPRLTHRWQGRAGPLVNREEKGRSEGELTIITSKMCFLTMKAGPISFLFPRSVSVFTLLYGWLIRGVGASSLDVGSGLLLCGPIS